MSRGAASRSRAAERGFSLVELLVAMAVVGLLLGAVFLTFTNFLTESANQASLSAQSLDVRTGLNQVRRDLSSTGMGIPDGDMDTAVAGTASSVTIRSTGVTGRNDDNENPAGAVAVIQSGPSANGIPDDASGVVLTPAREYVDDTGSTTNNRFDELDELEFSLKTTKLFYVTRTSPNFYERQYRLGADCSEAGGDCGACADGTPDLIHNDTNGGSGPAAECVADFRVRYGFQTSDGDIDFSSTDPDNDVPSGVDDRLPDALKVGMVVQVGSEYRNEVRTESPVTYTDEDLDPDDGVDLSEEQQQYRWKVVEWTVPLPNIPR
ncbi:MAG: prepilin-type N-terminal cleavage/methylation domain-containing protein [Thiohalorhabdus sp.]